jgi:hypothetical protein
MLANFSATLLQWRIALAATQMDWSGTTVPMTSEKTMLAEMGGVTFTP